MSKLFNEEQIFQYEKDWRYSDIDDLYKFTSQWIADQPDQTPSIPTANAVPISERAGIIHDFLCFAFRAMKDEQRKDLINGYVNSYNQPKKLPEISFNLEQWVSQGSKAEDLKYWGIAIDFAKIYDKYLHIICVNGNHYKFPLNTVNSVTNFTMIDRREPPKPVESWSNIYPLGTSGLYPSLDEAKKNTQHKCIAHLQLLTYPDGTITPGQIVKNG